MARRCAGRERVEQDDDALNSPFYHLANAQSRFSSTSG
jgi:hypothetical protein